MNKQFETQGYRVIVFARGATEVLLTGEGDRLRLPEVNVPRSERVTQNLSLAMKAECGLEVICLFELDEKAPSDARPSVRYEVTELWRSVADIDVPLKWIRVADIAKHAEIPDRRAVEKSLELCLADRNECCGEVFGGLGWFGDLRKWVEEQVGAQGFHLRSDFCQLNASASFSLIRFTTDGPAVWFKAVGEPKRHEFPVTVVLSKLFPSYLPQTFSLQPAWNGWLSWECAGSELSVLTGRGPWEAAARNFAAIQVKSLANAAQLLEAGARDFRQSTLLEAVNPFLNLIGELMRLQTKSPPAPLTGNDLELLGKRIEDALARIDRCAIPDSLGHLDLNPGNIWVNSGRCQFLDWSEAYVGHPFYTFEYLLRYLGRACNSDEMLARQVTDSYFEPWKKVLSPDAVTESLAVTPLLAAFVYGLAITRDIQRLQNPDTMAYLRSLARTMNSEANTMSERRLQCQG